MNGGCLAGDSQAPTPRTRGWSHVFTVHGEHASVSVTIMTCIFTCLEQKPADNEAGDVLTLPVMFVITCVDLAYMSWANISQCVGKSSFHSIQGLEKQSKQKP